MTWRAFRSRWPISLSDVRPRMEQGMFIERKLVKFGLGGLRDRFSTCFSHPATPTDFGGRTSAPGRLGALQPPVVIYNSDRTSLHFWLMRTSGTSRYFRPDWRLCDRNRDGRTMSLTRRRSISSRHGCARHFQMEDHFTLALETGYQASEKPISEAIIESVLPKQIDDLEPTLARHGYTPKVLAELLGAKAASCNKPVYGTDICDPDRECLRAATANRRTCRRQ
jgi:hypothetical protein